MSRTIFHSDLNAFYASVEQLRNPRLANVPMAVAGSAEARPRWCLHQHGQKPIFKLNAKNSKTIPQSLSLCWDGFLGYYTV